MGVWKGGVGQNGVISLQAKETDTLVTAVDDEGKERMRGETDPGLRSFCVCPCL